MTSNNPELREVDGYRIRDALLRYLSSRTESDLQFLKEDLARAEPEIDAKGVLRIDEWFYDQNSKTLKKYLRPDRPCGYDYVVNLSRCGNTWIVKSVDRIEVFFEC